MKIYCDISLERFDAWSGGEDTLEVLRDKGLCDRLEFMIEDVFNDGCTDTELNDFLWFERDTIAEWLGFRDWEDLENDGEEDEEDEDFAQIETCPHCGSENEYPMWNTEELGFVAVCKYCGKEIFLCDACQHTIEYGEVHNCDWCKTEYGGKCHRGITKY